MITMFLCLPVPSQPNPRKLKVWTLEPLVTLICHVTLGLHQYIQASPLTLTAVGQKMPLTFPIL